MTDFYHITEEQLHAFIDDELLDHERVQVLEAIENDEAIAQTVNQLRKDMDLLELAYASPPPPVNRQPLHRPAKWGKVSSAIAAGVLLMAGTLGGMSIMQQDSHEISDSFTAVNEYVPAIEDDRILVHVSNNDSQRLDSALNKVEEILQHSLKSNARLDVLVVANASGLALVREGSPYAERINALSKAHSNVRFLACGFAMENVSLKEGKEMKLLPEANKIPAALPEILDRLEQGWLYVKS